MSSCDNVVETGLLALDVCPELFISPPSPSPPSEAVSKPASELVSWVSSSSLGAWTFEG